MTAPSSPSPDVLSDDASGDRRRFVQAMVLAGLTSTALYASLIRGWLGQRIFSNFYDIQARALLNGHLDVPSGSLGIEAFVVEGRHYVYFPPGPALLRMPILAMTDRFDGRLTTVSMFAAWTLTIVLLALLIWRVRTIMRPQAALGRWETAAYGLLLIAGTAGSTVLFLGSIPWVYHEAYAWAIAMALGSLYSLLGVIEHATAKGLIATTLFTTGAVLSRTTAGYAVAGAVLLTAVLLPRRHPQDEDSHLWWKLYAVGALPIAVGMAVNWAKFGHPFLFPIQNQVFTSLNEHRREAIIANGGDLFSPNLIWSTLVNYFRPDGIRFTGVFPFISLPDRIAPAYGGGFIDQANRTGSIVSFMPLLVGLAVWGVATAFRRGADAGARLVRIPLLGAMAVPAGIMFYAYIAHRYTSEFVPLLLLGSVVGVVDISRRMTARTLTDQRWALGIIAALTLFGVVATQAAARNTQAIASPGPVLADYVRGQEQASVWFGRPPDLVRHEGRLPLVGRADDVLVLGDCRALYLGTGDEFRPWVDIAIQPMALGVLVTDPGPSTRGSIELASFEGHDRLSLLLERSPREGFRLVLSGGAFGVVRSDYFDVPAGGTFDVSVTAGDEMGFRITAGPEVVLETARDSYDTDWRWLPNALSPTPISTGQASSLGVAITPAPTPPLELCERLVAESRG